VNKKLRAIPVILIALVTLYYFYPDTPLPDKVITKIVVIKSKRTLEVYSGSVLLKTYFIALGKQPAGKKESAGDNKTPEGIYSINAKNAGSGFHKNLGISYPNAHDIALSKKKKRSTGGEIKIHGLKNGIGFIGKFHRLRDWTAGCIAVTNDEIDELYAHVRLGTPIVILP
jgi:murein L,D-transpeptidase YafK